MTSIKKTRCSPEIKNEIYNDYKFNYYTGTAVINKYGISRKTLFNICHQIERERGNKAVITEGNYQKIKYTPELDCVNDCVKPLGVPVAVPVAVPVKPLGVSASRVRVPRIIPSVNDARVIDISECKGFMDLSKLLKC